MPLETPARPRSPMAPELALPPPFSAVRLREVGDAFAHAVSIAAEQGAGTLVYVGRFDLAEFAVVLEPDVAAVFKSSESVNALLRSVIAAFLAAAEP